MMLFIQHKWCHFLVGDVIKEMAFVKCFDRMESDIEDNNKMKTKADCNENNYY